MIKIVFFMFYVLNIVFEIKLQKYNFFLDYEKKLILSPRS